MNNTMYLLESYLALDDFYRLISPKIGPCCFHLRCFFCLFATFLCLQSVFTSCTSWISYWTPTAQSWERPISCSQSCAIWGAAHFLQQLSFSVSTISFPSCLTPPLWPLPNHSTKSKSSHCWMICGLPSSHPQRVTQNQHWSHLSCCCRWCTKKNSQLWIHSSICPIFDAGKVCNPVKQLQAWHWSCLYKCCLVLLSLF